MEPHRQVHPRAGHFAVDAVGQISAQDEPKKNHTAGDHYTRSKDQLFQGKIEALRVLFS